MIKYTLCAYKFIHEKLKKNIVCLACLRTFKEKRGSKLSNMFAVFIDAALLNYFNHAIPCPVYVIHRQAIESLVVYTCSCDVILLFHFENNFTLFTQVVRVVGRNKGITNLSNGLGFYSDYKNSTLK